LPKHKLLTSKTIFLDVTANNYSEVFEYVYERLLKRGYVEASFLDAIIEREKKYPTGLQGVGQVIAIPHAEPANIKKTFIAAVRTAQTVEFMEMTNSGRCLKTRIVFILGLRRSGEQVRILKAIIDNFARKETAAVAFLKARNIAECLEILRPLETDEAIKQ